MVNRIRGETPLVIAEKEYAIVLGLGALAEIEDALGIENFEEALDFTKPSAKKMRSLLLAILKGNGINVADPVVLKEINSWSFAIFFKFFSELMENSGLSEARADGGEARDDNPLAEGNAGASG